MQQNKYCDIQDYCKLLCEANKNYNEALRYIGKTELEKDALRTQISFLKFDNKFYDSLVIKPANKQKDATNIDNSPRTATEIIRGNKLAEIKKICTENLKYRNTMGGYVPTRPTRVLEKIIEIIDKEN